MKQSGSEITDDLSKMNGGVRFVSVAGNKNVEVMEQVDVLVDGSLFCGVQVYSLRLHSES